MKLSGKKILIGVTGGIAAYKIPILIRNLIKEGAEVQVIMTPDAHGFVTPLTLSTLSGRPVLTDFFDKKNGTWNSHVDLALWADLMLIAPATANTLAKMNHGMADNLLLAVYLSARCRVVVAPTMDLDMMAHVATQQNIAQLAASGVLIIPAEKGFLASGLTGEGRMPEPETLSEYIIHYFNHKSILAGTSWIVTAGPTFEAIDPIRYIGNHSSGKMGIAIADALAIRGAHVTLIAGPSSVLHKQPTIRREDITSAEEMLEAVEKHFAESDGLIMAAAVADYKPLQAHTKKIKKSETTFTIKLTANTDILARMGQLKQKQLLIGFALETHDAIKHAEEKLHKKNLDAIVLNSLQDAGAGFGYETNQITIISKQQSPVAFPLKSKTEVAEDIVSFAENLFHT